MKAALLFLLFFQHSATIAVAAATCGDLISIATGTHIVNQELVRRGYPRDSADPELDHSSLRNASGKVYKVDRDLNGANGYYERLNKSFVTQLDQFARTENGFYVDVGPGKRLAQKELLDLYPELNPKRLIALSPRHFLWSNFNKILGKWISALGKAPWIETVIEQTPDSWLATLNGQAALVSDVYGALSYSKELDKVLEMELSFLKAGGDLYAQIGVRTKFMDVNGKSLTWKDLEAKSEGFEITEQNPEEDNIFAGKKLHFVRTVSEVKIPRMILLRFYDGRPPHRVYLVL